MWVYVVVAHGDSNDAVDSAHWTEEGARAQLCDLADRGVEAHVERVEVRP